MVAFYDNKPSKYEAVGNGSYLYRWDIKEVQQPANGDSEDTVTKWECKEVTVWLPITANKITEAVISQTWENNYEQKLINEYNAAKLGIYGATTSEEAKARIQAYKEFLQARTDIKTQVDADCAELGIL
jgi:hypothetical protein